jgi:hypothetical protein
MMKNEELAFMKTGLYLHASAFPSSSPGAEKGLGGEQEDKGPCVWQGEAIRRGCI